jgi:hypothetical protein
LVGKSHYSGGVSAAAEGAIASFNYTEAGGDLVWLAILFVVVAISLSSGFRL